MENKLGPETKKLKTETIVDAQEYLEKILSSLDASKYKRDWIARRVDLIVCPIDQFPFAILGNLILAVFFFGIISNFFEQDGLVLSSLTDL